MDKQRLNQIIEEKKDVFINVSDKIWEYAETRFVEVKSSELLCEILESEGFSIEKNIADIDTAFVASFGSGNPVVAILGEYDALSGMSQKPGIAEKVALSEGASGHGCGHNLLGAGSLAAAVAVKKFMEENKILGTIRYYGCPGEEGGSGKTFMARAGAFNDVDIALTWHPLTHNKVMSMNTLANYQIYYRFYGRSAHAAAVPHLGRSALDAVELMNVGVNYLREHIIQEARVHYAVTNTGGSSPNVVQAEAEVLYLIRAPKVNQVQEIYERVCNIAKGAALMTDTRCEIVFDKACSDIILNNTLEKLLYKNFIEVGVPQLDESEMQFAKTMRNTLAASDISSDLRTTSEYMGGEGQEIVEKLKEKVVSDIILLYSYSAMKLPISTDVGDVSWIVPTAQLGVACNVFGTPGHSWQTVAQGKTSFAHKGMLVAGKVLARTAVDALIRPEVVAEAKEELKRTLAGAKYVSPIPAGVKPSFIK
ncbi:M20 family metallopeptidase [Sporomusa sp. KB1]|jgi:aminobenzoyl-glutamate utilization protein B|uniref:M20 family metallopeptidase n=1 Tax=Sporomusa sp. KB1 TaxID=943346 RepID=UPI0011A07C62|nr:M20 family metallopeptidase [Sporomusa sp. KB1]TWH47279.1 aminobenzoyl-glutamate utilization protein B [Sporomusa sp. KB1]